MGIITRAICVRKHIHKDQAYVISLHIIPMFLKTPYPISIKFLSLEKSVKNRPSASPPYYVITGKNICVDRKPPYIFISFSFSSICCYSPNKNTSPVIKSRLMAKQLTNGYISTILRYLPPMCIATSMVASCMTCQSSLDGRVRAYG